MIPMKIEEPIAKFVCKIMKSSLHFYESILPKEYVTYGFLLKQTYKKQYPIIDHMYI